MSIFDCLFNNSTEKLLEKLMTTLSDFIAAQKAAQDKMSRAFDGLSQDIKSLNDKITALQASVGDLSDDDKASLEAIQAESAALADKYADLDAQNDQEEAAEPEQPAEPQPNNDQPADNQPE